MEIKHISEKENFVPTVYPQFEAQINGEFCRVSAIHHEGSSLEDIDITPLDDFFGENIYNTLNDKEAQEIQNILWDIVDNCKLTR